MKSLAHARLKRTRAVELLAKGCTYDEIARRVGYAHRGSAHRAVAKALREREAESIDCLRATQLTRLDELESAVWDQAVQGDYLAALAALRILDQRSRLLGLYDRDRGGGESRPSGFASLVVEG